jgi:hypothetical protein
MAKVTRRSTGYEFAGMSAVALRLVNEFQQRHSLLCEPSSQPDFRFIRLGSLQQNLLLGELVANVRAEDTEPLYASGLPLILLF